MRVEKIGSKQEKMTISNSVLRALPDWFEIESAIIDYVHSSADMPFFAVYNGNQAAGFVAIKKHNPYTSEIYAMGVLKEFHRSGMGRQLLAAGEAYCKGIGNRFLTVKTLAASIESEAYEKTRLFYQSMGFLPIEVFTALWGKENPCLFLAKYLQT